MAAALAATFAASGPVFADGGTPIGDQGIEAQRQNWAMKHGAGDPALQVQRGERPGRIVDSHGNSDRGDNYRNRDYRSDHRYRGRDNNRHYDARGHRYYGPRYDSYAYASPYYAAPYYDYAPPPVAYDPYPSPGISLFFSF